MQINGQDIQFIFYTFKDRLNGSSDSFCSGRTISARSLVVFTAMITMILFFHYLVIRNK